MSRSILLGLLPCVLTLGCGAVALVAGGGGEKFTVLVILPETILVGDTVQAAVKKQAQDGSISDGTATGWRSSDPSAVSVDGQGRVVGKIAGRQATITADIGNSHSGSVPVTVGDDQRFAYALADRPTPVGAYAPDQRYNSSGGTVEVSRPSPGTYTVRFAGLARTLSQHDDVQVSAYQATPGGYCKLGADWSSSGPDLLADVRCHAADGSPVDNRFTILLSGAHAFTPATPVGFSYRPPGFQTGNVDTAGAAYNLAGGGVQVTRNGTGVYSLAWPGLEGITPGSTVTALATAVGGQNTARCRVGAIDPPHSGLQVRCAAPDGQATDSRWGVLWMARGRVGTRAGYLWADKPTSAIDYTPEPSLSFNSSGGAITARQLTTGSYRVVFGGLARPAGASDIVVVTPFGGNDRTCSITSWANSGADLTILLACFDPSGAPASTPFNLLLIQ